MRDSFRMPVISYDTSKDKARAMNDIDISGTHRVGELSATYAEIVAAFGEPNDKGDGYKTQVEWHLKSPTGDVATIYDYKQSVAYNGADGIPAEEVTYWSIGGRNPAVADWVQARIRKLMPTITPDSFPCLPKLTEKKECDHRVPNLDDEGNPYCQMCTARGRIVYGKPGQPDHLLHLTLTWAARGLLTMTDDWRNRRVLLSGKQVSDEVELAANALYAQWLIFLPTPGIMGPSIGAIRGTAAGLDQLAEWDALAAGVIETATEG